MNNLKCAELSPRICKDGSIRWYEGDTFSLNFTFNLTDENGEPIEFTESDKLTICFRNTFNEILHEFESVGTNILNVEFTKEISEKFKVGKYTYCVRFNGSEIRTLMRNNLVFVE